MAEFIMYTLGGSVALTGLMGQWGNTLNAGSALIKVLPWIGMLGNISGSASTEMKTLHSSLVELAKACDKNDFETFATAAEKVEKAIDVLLNASDKKTHFKKWRYRDSWKSYLNPLSNLKEELNHFRTRGIKGYDTGKLEEPMKAAVEFLNKEIDGQKGLLQKTIGSVVNAGQNELGHLFSTPESSEDLGELELHPLFNIQSHLKKFRFNQEGNYRDYTNKVLEQDLKDLEKTHPLFKEVYDYVMSQSKDLVSDMDTHLFNFLLNKVAPYLNEEVLYQEIYDVAKAIDHVSKKSTEKPKEWGEKWLKEWGFEHNAKEIQTLLSAVASTLEISRFDSIVKEIIPTKRPTKGEVEKKLTLALQHLRNHPSITKHPKFNENFGNLLGRYFSVTQKLLGESALSGLQVAFRLKSQGRIAEAFLVLRNLYKSGTKSEETSSLMKTLNTLGSVATQMGIPENQVKMVTSVAKSLESTMKGSTKTEEKAQRAPLMRLYNRLQNFRSEPQAPFIMQSQLQEDLKMVERKNPEFFTGLSEYGKNNLIQSADKIVNTFILRKLQNPSKPFLLSFYQTLEHHGVLENGEKSSEKIKQQKTAAKYLRQIQENFKPHDTIEKPLVEQALWEATTLSLDHDKLLDLYSIFTNVNDSTSLEELAEKVELGLAHLENNPHIAGVSGMLEGLAKGIFPIIQATYNIVKQQKLLSPIEQKEVEFQLNQAWTLGQKGNLASALKVLKGLYETGPLAKAMSKLEKESPLSALGVLAQDFTEKSSRTEKKEKGEITVEMIDEKRGEFVENLAYFSAFQIVDSHCKYTGYERTEPAIQLRYKKIHAELEKITDKSERKEKLVTLLKQQIDSRKNLNFFQKAVGKLMMGFVLSAVTYFAEHFTKTLTASAHGFLMNPVESPLSNGHLVPIKGINNAMLSLLAAEEIWREDTKGELGAESKQEKIFKILNKPNLNGGMEVNELIKEVVRTAINEFLKPGSLAKSLKGQIDKISMNGSANGRTFMIKALGILGGYLILPFLYLFDALYSFVLKKGAASLINRLGIVNTVLETMNSSIYTNAKYTSGIDRILLDQLKAVEEMLDKEGGEVLLTEGDNGRRLFGELTSNLFKLLDERGQLSPGQISKRDNLLKSLKQGVDEMADEQLKGIIRDLLIFAYEALRSKDGMNGTVYSILDEANKALQPSDYSRIWLLYDAEEQKKIQQDLRVKELKVDHLINYFAKKIGKEPHELVNLDLDNALNKKYSQAESELHLTMERLLNKVVSNVVETGVGDLLQTPEETILNHLIWVENQWLPHCAMEQTSAPTYLDEMKKLMLAANEKGLACNQNKGDNRQLKAEFNQAFEPIKKRHSTYLVQLQNRLKLLESKKGGSPHTDHLISSLTRMAEREMKELQILSDAVAEHRLKDAWQALGELEKLKRREEVLISAVRFSIESREEGVLGQLTEWGGRLIRSGVKAVAPNVGNYVVGRLNSRAQGVIHMYKDPNVFHSLLRHVVLLNFLNYPEAPKGNPNDSLPHAPSDIGYGWYQVN